jgi:hypothetical protein
MSCSRLTLLFGVIAMLSITVGSARGAGAEFTIAGGATQLQIEGGGELDGQWGPWVQPSLSFAPFNNTPQFRLGGGISLAWISADVDDDFISGQADLFLFTPELLASWRQPISDHLYLEPGVGVGAVIGALDFVGAEWGAGYSVRPFVRLGYQFESWSTGIEAAYRFGNLELGGVNENIQNLSVGVFFALNL